MNHKLLILVLSFLFALSTNLVWQSQAEAKGEGYDKHHKMLEWHGKWHQMRLDDKFFHKAHFVLIFADEIGLSEEQIDAIKALKHETKKKLIQYEADIEVLALDIKAKLYEKPPLDVEGTHALVDQKYEIKKAKVKHLVSSFAELKSIVTEEQWIKLRNVWKEKF